MAGDIYYFLMSMTKIKRNTGKMLFINSGSRVSANLSLISKKYPCHRE